MRKPLALLACLVSGCATARSPWRDVETPGAGPVQVIGSYAGGCLNGATSLTPDGPGYQMMRLGRRRFYGTPELVGFIQSLGAEVKRRKLGVLLVGDLGLPRGGPTLSGHASHQTGLDVDVWFWHPKAALARSLTLDERERLDSPSVLAAGRDSLDPSLFGKREIAVLKAAATRSEVDRIFVNPVIKRELCRLPGDRAWIAKLRPWWGHDDHFHVRLRCPEGQTECGVGAMDPLPEGDSCDETLEWWFSEEAREKAREMAEKPAAPKMPDLPDACAAVLQAPDQYVISAPSASAQQRKPVE